VNAFLSGVDWNDFRIKAWHAMLLLAAAYSAYNPRWSWAAPVLTGVAGASTSSTAARDQALAGPAGQPA
jgi:hypothetical protein